MSIVGGMTKSYRKQLMQGLHDLEDDTIKVALYDSTATLNRDTTVYTTTGEITGTGYTAGGVTLANKSFVETDDYTLLKFDDPQWTGATFSDVVAALFYNSTQSDASILILPFATPRSITSGTFNIDRESDLVRGIIGLITPEV